ncbi:MAG TPA: DUF6519 domain-containing protein [Pyrinomonadaceae bacterium]
MKSDITRDTFHPSKHFSRVISQQGRVMLDADNNEQTSILLHYLRTLAMDLIGPYAAPVMRPGFGLLSENDDIFILPGRYYVSGILVQNNARVAYGEQPYFVVPSDDAFAKSIASKANANYWVYLDVWERLVTSIEDDSIRESALGGPDTCSRAQVAWQVKALDVATNTQNTKAAQRLEWLEKRKKTLEDQLAAATTPEVEEIINAKLDRVNKQIDLVKKLQTRLQNNAPFGKDDCALPIDQLLPRSDAFMAARLNPGLQLVDACITSPDSKYRGAENQHYRVEIHRGGVAGEATITWSRENGSVATTWIGTTEYDLHVTNARGFSAGNWVELMDDATEFQERPGILARLSKVQGGTLTVDKDSVDQALLAWSSEARNPRIRRWDHFQTEDTVLEDDGSILIVETAPGTSDDDATWIDLEDGLQIQFSEGGEYRTGDYWLIPARVATGSIEWPAAENGMTKQLPPRGVLHHFAPLAFATWANGSVTFAGCDCTFAPLSTCFKATDLPADFEDVAPGPAARPGTRERRPRAATTRRRTTRPPES